MITIRRATPEDAEIAQHLLVELGYVDDVRFLRERIAFFNDGKPDQAVFVAEQDGIVVGILAFRAFPYFHKPGKQGRVIALVVTECARGQGVGKALMRHAEEFATECGCQKMELTTGTQRKEAHRFYESMGYEETSKRYLKPLE
jgi:GNAT superfamily N-acetyltransferase